MPPVIAALGALGSSVGIPTGAAAVSGGTVLAGGTLAGGLALSGSAKRARERAETQAAETRRRQDEQIAKLESQQADIEKGDTEKRVRNEARTRQRQKAVGARGRRSTILTTPLGLPGGSQQSGAQKRLTGE